MRQFISIFIILAHLIATLGVTVDIHECGGAYSYSVLGASMNSGCSCDHDDAEHSDDCCQSKKIEIKAKSDIKLLQQKQFLKLIPFMDAISIVHLAPVLKCPLINNYINCFTIIGKAPGLSPPHFILYQNFRI